MPCIKKLNLQLPGSQVMEHFGGQPIECQPLLFSREEAASNQINKYHLVQIQSCQSGFLSKES